MKKSKKVFYQRGFDPFFRSRTEEAVCREVLEYYLGLDSKATKVVLQIQDREPKTRKYVVVKYNSITANYVWLDNNDCEGIILYQTQYWIKAVFGSGQVLYACILRSE